MAEKKTYDKEYKIQAVKLGREIGISKAARELGINTDTLWRCWYSGSPDRCEQWLCCCPVQLRTCYTSSQQFVRISTDHHGA